MKILQQLEANYKQVLVLFPIALILIMFVPNEAQAQDKSISVSLNVKHEVAGISTFDRKKYINVHESLTGNDWQGEYDKMDYLIGDLDVYLGRDNGSLGWNMNQATEDPNKEGYVLDSYTVSKGEYYRETVYGQQRTETHKHDDHADVLVGGQVHTYWPGQKTRPYNDPENGWMIGGPNAENAADAGGEFMGRYFEEFYRNDGEAITKGKPRPRFMEILNEPLYELIDGVDNPTVTPTDIFQYHNDVADAIRRNSPDILIGGYTAAFPVFEEDNFQRWNDRHKLFYDMSGEKMDFISLHFYDHHRHHLADGNNSTFEGPWYYSGGRMEATFDMLDQYSMMKFGTIKPYLISEFAGKDHATSWKTWTPQRDWYIMKSLSPMMLQFMQRPDDILKTIPFLVLKAEWGRTNVPYNPRLMIQNFEKEGETGEHWVWSELIKFYELWSDVNGTRVDVRTGNVDVLADAYVDGNKVYVIVTNMIRENQDIDLNLFEDKGNTLQSVSVKHLHMPRSQPLLDIDDLDVSKSSTFDLGVEATAIFEYTFANDVMIDETTEELKYYSDVYLQEIKARTPMIFNIDGLALSGNSNAILRVSLGREHGKKIFPNVKVNGVDVAPRTDFTGEDQKLRPQFFGMIEVDVPASLLQENNEIEVTYSDDGGYVSSVSMRLFNSTAGDPSSIDDNLVGETTFKLSPNPSDGLVNVVLSKSYADAVVKIVDLSGQVVFQAQVDDKTSQLDLSHLSSGIYIALLKTAEESSTTRLVLK